MITFPPRTIPTMFSEQTNHYASGQQPRLNTFVHPRYQQDGASEKYNLRKRKLANVISLLLPQFTTSTLRQLQLTCVLLDTTIRLYFWKRPSFHTDPKHSALTLFKRFLAHLPHCRQVTRLTIRELCLTPMEESLYERVPKDFFETLIQYTTALTSLNLSHAAFFSHSSLPASGSWKLAHLTSLDVSYVEHMTDRLLLQLAFALPSLCLIRLDGTQVNHGVGQLADQCSQLRSLSLKHTPVTDEALAALAKFRTININELDISDCRKITCNGLDMVARYCVHMSWLGLEHTPISLATLRHYDHRFWKYLDIAHCSRLHQDIIKQQHFDNQQSEDQHRSKGKYRGDILAGSSPPSPSSAQKPSLYSLIVTAPKLQHLSLSMPVAQYLIAAHQQFSQRENTKTNLLVDVDVPYSLVPVGSPSKINQLILHDIPENTPLTFLDDLISLFPMAKQIKLIRGYYESDVMCGSFADDITFGSTDTNDKSKAVITEESIKHYRLTSKCNLSILLERNRELLEGAHMW